MGQILGLLPPNLNNSDSPYSFPSCFHVWAVITPSPSPLPSCSQVQARRSIPPSTCRGSPVSILQVLDKLALSPVLPELDDPFVAADTATTNHMLADKTCFISYKSISNVLVCMGNNLFIPVLGCGKAIFSLNEKLILVWNALHVPGLAIPLYSL